MDYTLAVLTHGDSATIDRAVNSFMDKVRPAPAHVLVYKDGSASGGPEHQWEIQDGSGWDHRLGGEQRGFCHATGELWQWATEQDTEFVFWLEHDFTFLRPVHLSDLAEPLLEDLKLAQMQLMRNAVSVEEIAAGGLYEMRRADYEPSTTDPLPEGTRAGERSLLHWLMHRAYFTTNPSLMRTAWMAEHPWLDDGQPFCEGRFGIDLVKRGFHFGVWGHGEPWVEHIGQRTGFGY